jgi:nucleoside-diphosphate-sugar epimerase
MKKKILITGGAGFIGFHLANELLSHGYRVDLVDSLGRGVRDSALNLLLTNHNVRLFELDLCDPSSFNFLPKDYSEVFHLAAIVGVKHVLSNPYDVLRSNCNMLANAIDFGRRQTNLSRFLFASTSEVYAGSVERTIGLIPTIESTPIVLPELKQPRTSYMLSKLYGEAMCLQSGLPVTIFRPHNVYGPRMGMAHVIPELMGKAYHSINNSALEVASIDHSRAFCFIDDAIQMMIKLMLVESACGEVVNLGNQREEIAIGHLAELVVNLVGRMNRIVPIEATAGSPNRRCPDMSYMEKLTGVTAQVSLEDGLKKTFTWYKNNVFDVCGLTSI